MEREHMGCARDVQRPPRARLECGHMRQAHGG